MSNYERRKYERHESEKGITIMVDGSEVKAKIVNISLDGICIVSKTAIKKESDVCISLNHINMYTIYGVVTWVSTTAVDGEKNHYTMGIEIESIEQTGNDNNGSPDKAGLAEKIISETTDRDP